MSIKPLNCLEIPRHLLLLVNKIRRKKKLWHTRSFILNFRESSACDCGAEHQNIKQIVVVPWTRRNLHCELT